MSIRSQARRVTTNPCGWYSTPHSMNTLTTPPTNFSLCLLSKPIMSSNALRQCRNMGSCVASANSNCRSKYLHKHRAKGNNKSPEPPLPGKYTILIIQPAVLGNGYLTIRIPYTKKNKSTQRLRLDQL